MTDRLFDKVIFKQQFGMGDDGAQWRPQFVRDKSEELVFEVFCLAAV